MKHRPNLRQIVLSHLAAGNRGTTFGLARDVQCGPYGIRDQLLKLEQEGLVRRSRQTVRVNRRDCVRHEELHVWEIAEPAPEPAEAEPDPELRINARRAVLLRARAGMGQLGEWAHGRSA